MAGHLSRPAAGGAPRDREWPTVSVVVINYNGREYLERCIAPCGSSTTPPSRVEIVLIDNASTDGSVQMVRQRTAPGADRRQRRQRRLLPGRSTRRRGLANGEYLALLNNDAEADPNWLAAAVRLPAEPRTGRLRRQQDPARRPRDHRLRRRADGLLRAWASRVQRRPADFRRTPRRADAVRLGRGDGRAPGAVPRRRRVRRDVLRLLRGRRLRLAPVGYGHEDATCRPRVFHRHHGTIERFGYARERYLLERNALATIVKNYGDELLARSCPGRSLLTLLRGLADRSRSGLPDFRITDDTSPIEDVALPAITAAHLAAIRDWVVNLADSCCRPSGPRSRRRRAPRTEILPLFEETLLPNVIRPRLPGGVRQRRRGPGASPRRCAPDPTCSSSPPTTSGKKMAGPAIRCWEMATVLSAPSTTSCWRR
jgi:glycosyltransferase involved in cell wall biosynthesis